MAFLDQLPPEIARELARERERERILNTKQAAEVRGVSVVHFRRLVRAGQAAQPIRVGQRKFGFRYGDCLDDLQARREAAKAS